MPTFDLLAEIEQENEEREQRVQDGAAPSRFDGIEERRDPGFGRTLGSALANENTISSINRTMSQHRASLTGPRIDVDQVMANNTDYQAQLSQLPEEYGDLILEARTEEELRFILRAGTERVRNAEQLQNGGLGQSILSHMAVGLVDPVDWVVTVGTGGLGRVATTGNAIRRGAVGALSAGTANLAVETVIDDPTRDGTDQVAAFALGLGIGGILNMRGGARTPRDADDAQLMSVMGQKIDEAIQPTTRRTAADFDLARYLETNRTAESGGDDLAAASTSSAFGRYQFIQSTWVDNYKATFGDTGESRAAILAKRADGDIQDQVMQTFTENNLRQLREAGVPATNSTAYLAHFLGTDDAIKVLRAAPETPIGDVVRAASINANEAVFRNMETAGDLIGWSARKMGDPETSIPTAPSIAQAANDVGVDRVDLGGQLFSPASAGAAAREVEDVEYFGTKFLLPGAYGKLLDTSVPKDMRGLASELIAGTSRVDNNTRAIAAEEISASLERSWRGANYASYNPHFVSWRKEQGIGAIRGDLTSGPQQQFMREVTRSMLGDTNVSAQAKAAAKSFSDSYGEVLRRAKEARIEGFDDIAENVNYVPRRINSSKFMQVRNAIGAGGVQRILRNAMEANGMDPKLAERVAKAYETGTLDRITNRRVDTFTGPSEDSIERLRYYLPSDDPELVDDVIGSLKLMRREGNPDGGRISEARHRIDMDLMRPITIDGQTFRALDLFEDDAALLFERYARTMSGWVGLAERSGIRSQNDWDIRLGEVVKGKEGDPRTAERIERLNEIKDLILGRSITSENGTARRAGQAFMKLNFATSMGQAGMASIAEMGNILASMGIKNAMAHMPAFRKMVGAGPEELDHAFTDELQALWGVGTRTKTSRGRAGYDEFGGEIESKMFDTLDRILDPAARGVGYAGLIGPVNDYLQVLASKSFLQKLSRVAVGENSFSAADKARLRDAGFEDGVLDRILASLKENGTYDGKRLVSLNADKWDRELLAELQYSTDRMVYRAVQENDIGSSAWWMHTMIGRMATQFRSFIINAYVKQTLHALRFRDRQAFAGLMFTTTFGGMAYMARAYWNTATDPEARERQMTPQRLATAAMSATGYASILPTVVDTGLVQSGNDPLFSHVRTTGLSTSLIQGAPIVATTDNLVSTATLPARLLRDDYEFSQDDLNRITRLLPFNNVTGIRNAIDLVEAELPRRSQEDDFRQ